MSRVVFLLEELSMKRFLDNLLPRVLPELAFVCVPHEGKADLEKSIPRKLRGWREPGVRFVVVRDNDEADCVAMKQRLVDLCATAGRPDTLVRIACQELEAWYFGDLAAVERAYGRTGLRGLSGKRQFRDPDRIRKPSKELTKILPEFQKVDGARRLGLEVSEDLNRSISFGVFMGGVRRVAGEVGYGEGDA